jgi:hypothetical protein
MQNVTSKCCRKILPCGSVYLRVCRWIFTHILLITLHTSYTYMYIYTCRHQQPRDAVTQLASISRAASRSSSARPNSPRMDGLLAQKLNCAAACIVCLASCVCMYVCMYEFPALKIGTVQWDNPTLSKKFDLSRTNLIWFPKPLWSKTLPKIAYFFEILHTSNEASCKTCLSSMHAHSNTHTESSEPAKASPPCQSLPVSSFLLLLLWCWTRPDAWGRFWRRFRALEATHAPDANTCAHAVIRASFICM